MKINSKIGILLMLLVATALAACGSTNNADQTATSGDSNQLMSAQNSDRTILSSGIVSTTEPSEVTTELPEITAPPDTDTQNKVAWDSITYSTGFSEGLAFVRVDGIENETHCIDKQGNIVFTLEGIFGYEIGFHNGLALIRSGVSDANCLCTTEGELIYAEDLGATSILMDYGDSDIFADGYIFLEKVTTDFTGSVYEMAILNSKLETIVEMSETLHECYSSNSYRSNYYDGYLYWDDKYLDLRTGIEAEGKAELYSKITPHYESDFWGWDHRNHIVYDSRFEDESDQNVMIDLSEYSETLSGNVTFDHGYAYLCFDPGEKAFFTLLGEDGTFAYEPIESNALNDGYPDVISDDNTFLVYGHNQRIIETYDTTGKIAEMTIDNVNVSVTISDGVIQIFAGEYGDMRYYFYSTDLKPLFN